MFNNETASTQIVFGLSPSDELLFFFFFYVYYRFDFRLDNCHWFVVNFARVCRTL